MESRVGGDVYTVLCGVCHHNHAVRETVYMSVSSHPWIPDKTHIEETPSSPSWVNKHL